METRRVPHRRVRLRGDSLAPPQPAREANTREPSPGPLVLPESLPANASAQPRGSLSPVVTDRVTRHCEKTPRCEGQLIASTSDTRVRQTHVTGHRRCERAERTVSDGRTASPGPGTRSARGASPLTAFKPRPGDDLHGSGKETEMHRKRIETCQRKKYREQQERASLESEEPQVIAVGSARLTGESVGLGKREREGEEKRKEA